MSYRNIANALSKSNKERVASLLASSVPLDSISNHEKLAAVLVPFCSIDGIPHLLFTRRSSGLSAHPGEICFPGGRYDKSDCDLVQTAIREFKEEIGSEKNLDFNVMGLLQQPMRQFINRRNLIYAVIADIGEVYCHPRSRPNTSSILLQPTPPEVDEILLLQLSELCNPVNQTHTVFRMPEMLIQMPSYKVPNFPIIWGLTSRILTITIELMTGAKHQYIMKQLTQT